MKLKIFFIDGLKRAGIHLSFWVLVLVLYTYVFSVDNSIYTNIFYFSLFLMPTVIGTTYFSVYTLIPKYLLPKRYILFVVYTIYTLIISVVAIFFSLFFSLAYFSNFKFEDMNPISKHVFFTIICVYLVVIVASGFKLLKLNFSNTLKNNKLESKILQAELKLKENELQYLKMQIHPHFLFNTLNTMYAFALKKADETPEMILKLSNLLDYLLYQIDKPFVRLKDEMDHIKDYIDLEQLRFNDRLNIHLTESYGEDYHKIRPMILLPFVENSFKHGKIERGVLQINISVVSNDDHIQFKIQNSMDSMDNTGKGIGLENIKKRLEILYKNNYTLDITTENAVFDVNLVLNHTFDV